MNGHSIPGNNAERSFGGSVAGWKSEVRQFFDEDWTRLRNVIHELEEEAWHADSEAGAIAAGAAEGIERPAQADLSKPTIDGPRTSAASDRLSSLVRQIENRLQTNRDIES